MIRAEPLIAFLPNEVGEVSPSHGDGGVMDVKRHDPSVRCADTRALLAACGQNANPTSLRRKRTRSLI
jgi:hypothetical protein